MTSQIVRLSAQDPPCDTFIGQPYGDADIVGIPMPEMHCLATRDLQLLARHDITNSTAALYKN